MPERFDSTNQFYPPRVTVTPPSGERLIGRYDYEDGSYIKIALAGEIDTEAALEMAETLIDLKRKELARRKSRTESDIVNPQVSERPSSGIVNVREMIASARAPAHSGVDDDDEP